MDDTELYIVFEDEKGNRHKIPESDFAAFDEAMSNQNWRLIFE